MFHPTEIVEGQYITYNGYAFRVVGLIIDTDATPKLILHSAVDQANENAPYGSN